MSEPISILKDEEIDEIIVRTCAGSGPITKEELLKRSQRVLDWAVQARLDEVALKLVLAGKLDVVVTENQEEPIQFRSAVPAQKQAAG